MHPNDDVNLGQSSNDVFPTAMHVAVVLRTRPLLVSLARLRAALQAKAATFAGTVKVGRTHLQDATPIRLGQEFSAYGRTVTRHRNKLAQAADWLREQLG